MGKRRRDGKERGRKEEREGHSGAGKARKSHPTTELSFVLPVPPTPQLHQEVC